MQGSYNFMVCHAKSAIGDAPQAVIRNSKEHPSIHLGWRYAVVEQHIYVDWAQGMSQIMALSPYA